MSRYNSRWNRFLRWRDRQICKLWGHKPVKTFDFAYLHERCDRCGEELKVIATIEELEEAGILEVHSYPMPTIEDVYGSEELDEEEEQILEDFNSKMKSLGADPTVKNDDFNITDQMMSE